VKEEEEEKEEKEEIAEEESQKSKPNYLWTNTHRRLLRQRLSSITVCRRFCSSKLDGILDHLGTTKANDWHHLLVYLVPYVFRRVLDDEINNVLLRLSEVMATVLRPEIDMGKLDELEREMVAVMADMERLLPVTLFTIQIHKLIHLVQFIRWWGPLKSIWTYSVERFLGFLVEQVNSRTNPEKNLINNHALFHSLQLSIYRDPNPRSGTRNYRCDYIGMDPNTVAPMVECRMIGKSKFIDTHWSGREDGKRHWKRLMNFYKQEYPAYQLLLNEYEKDLNHWVEEGKRNARTKREKDQITKEKIQQDHPLFFWTPSSGRILSPEEESMRFTTEIIEKYNRALAGRFEFRSRDAELSDSNRSQQSNIMCKIPERKRDGSVVIEYYFGRIEYFFRHQFAGKSHELMYIHWYQFKYSEMSVLKEKRPQILDIRRGWEQRSDSIQPLDLLKSAEMALLAKLDPNDPRFQNHFRYAIRLQTTL
jgi:hypothetical protein